ncbi:hypothetical protein I3843_11G093100 [Carya illinoinensis]|uniref:Uncharacterized protein n=1 Tax=Carya illinoinensis TaxID=32201 RepID=A0A922IZ51_CARIL|nr:hypothetical protein I3760_11G091900 [Carya illinoinensis]KAG6687832.1 hypothetical protein I3842_11G093500 [Carya illinoinensis]KAG7955823.1 hypothetical protein I3843_11G093100 [Carya illinoinensis]
MAFYVDEEEVWKCAKHPSKRRRSGICHVCLRERLSILCPDCANVRPCSCRATAATTSSSSSSSSSVSRFSTSDGGVGAVGRVSNLIESEPAFRRSRSLAIPFLRSSSRFVGNESELKEPASVGGKSRASSFWSVFRSQKNKKVEVDEGNAKRQDEVAVEEEEGEDVRARRTMMMRSRSVAVSITSDSGIGLGGRESRGKGRSWYFPSPIKAFRQSKIAKVVQERSPLYRG